MKKIFTLLSTLFIGLLLLSCARNPALREIKTDYYEVTAPSIAYRSIQDTADAHPIMSPIKLVPGDAIFAINRINKRWVAVFFKNEKYYVLIANINIRNVLNVSKVAEANSTTTKQIQTGPRGGQYYINSNGNKTYIRHK